MRPVLEYNTHIWSPVYKTHVDLIERVQRRFTKMLDGLHALSYPDRLAATGLESLELRRLKSDLCMYFKIIIGQTCLSADEYFKFDCSVKLTRTSSNLKLVKPRYNTDLLKHNFFVRVVDAWNSLPIHVREAKFCKQFNSLLQCIDLKKFLVGSYLF